MGSNDSAPGPHDYFDAALVACKTLTATWYAKKNNIALERVEAHVERDAAQERAGRYLLKLRVAFHGPITDAERARLYAAVAHCPIHKLSDHERGRHRDRAARARLDLKGGLDRRAKGSGTSADALR